MTRRTRGFTLIEVMVALAVVAIGLTALMTAISSTAGASGYLRQKAQAQWIALNRLIEVRLNLQGFGAGLGTSTTTGIGSSASLAGSTTGSIGTATGTSVSSSDTGELDFANQHWHYDTQYFDTNVQTMRRVVVRVFAGAADTKGPALAEATGFIGTAVATPGSSNNVDWTTGTSTTAPGANGSNKTPGTTLPPAGSAAGGVIGNQGGLGGSGGTTTGGDASQNGGTQPPDGSNGTGQN